MELKEEKAIGSFRSGLNCAQSVLTAYSENIGFDNNFALAISCGFGSGMGRLQETCGAVTGSFMVLSIFNSLKYTDERNKKEETYFMIQKFRDKFKSIHGSLDCKTLLNVDLNTEEGQLYMQEHNLHESVCEKCIMDSLKILDGLLG